MYAEQFGFAASDNVKRNATNAYLATFKNLFYFFFSLERKSGRRTKAENLLFQIVFAIHGICSGFDGSQQELSYVSYRRAQINFAGEWAIY